MTVARFIADQRTLHRVPHAACCRLLGVSESWFYKWAGRVADGTLTPSEQHRGALDEAVAVAFQAANGKHGSPRLVADVREAGWTVSEKTVASSMRRQGLVARRIRRRRNTTRPDKTRKPFPDLLRRDFTARGPNLRWVGDMTEIPVNGHGKFYLATVIDLYSRRCLAAVHEPERKRNPGSRCDPDRGHSPWRAWRDPQRHLPHRPWSHIYRRPVHQPVPAATDQTVDGACRVVLRQCRRRGVLLLTGMGGPP